MKQLHVNLYKKMRDGREDFISIQLSSMSTVDYGRWYPNRSKDTQASQHVIWFYGLINSLLETPLLVITTDEVTLTTF